MNRSNHRLLDPLPAASLQLLACLLFWSMSGPLAAQSLLESPALPSRIAVLTFDDSVRSHFDVVRPLLLKYNFGATFFITEGFDFKSNKDDYMTWEQIAQLHRDGFEIGNHTRDHLAIGDAQVDQLDEQLKAIEDQCIAHGIPAPVSFAWPGNQFSVKALDTLKRHGIRWARRGGGPEFPYDRGEGVAYEPYTDHPLLIPSAGDSRPDWQWENFAKAMALGGRNNIVVLQFHGVPDKAHPWVNTPTDRFEQYLHWLAQENYQVIALRDLNRYIDASIEPTDPAGVIELRKKRLAAGMPLHAARPLPSGSQRSKWLENMAQLHRFSIAEISAATGMSDTDVEMSLQELHLEARPANDLSKQTPLESAAPPMDKKIRIAPYPGGRHPRIGFRDGALWPQRETKMSLFAPWQDGGYVVADFPEAIWWNSDSGRELLYLAHSHVPTIWDQKGIALEATEWESTPEGWKSTRKLPNGVTFETTASPQDSAVFFSMTVQNGTNKPLQGVTVQQCLMLGAADGFSDRTNTRHRHEGPFSLASDPSNMRWIITAWQSCQRAWTNPPCPCLHSDPVFPDCPPGQSQSLSGWVWFYEGKAIDQELDRLKSLLP
jgi:hypothetical protein